MVRFFVVFFLGLVGSILSAPSTVLAQEIEKTAVSADVSTNWLTQELPPDAVPSVAVLVADVNVTDVNVSEVDGKIVGTFSLQGGMGFQQHIVYGIMATNDQRDLLDIVSLGKGVSVVAGEIKTLPIEYQLPNSLQGDVTITLWAETETGLLLGTQVIHRTVREVKPQRLVCSKDEVPSAITCTSTIGGAYMISYYSGSLFAEPDLRESVDMTAGNTVRIAPTLPAGRYKVLVQNTAERELSWQTITIAGRYGKIVNAVVERVSQSMAALTVSLAADSVRGLVLEYSLTDASQRLCGSGKTTMNALAVVIDVVSDCESGKLTLHLRGGDGLVLDTKTEVFQMSPPGAVAPNTNPIEVPVSEIEKNSTFSLWFALLIALILTVLLVSFLIFRRKSKVSSMTLVAIFSTVVFFGGIEPASALSTMWQGEAGIMSTTSMSTDKSVYAPGESITFTSTTEFTNDHFGVTSHYVKFNVGFAWDYTSSKPKYDASIGGGTIPAFNGVGTPTPTQYGSPFSESDSITLIGPATTGEHSLEFRPLLETYTCIVCARYGYDITTFKKYFTVATISVGF